MRKALSSYQGVQASSRHRKHGVNDVLVSRAPTDITGQRLAGLRFVAWQFAPFSQRLHGHQNSRRAVPALQSVLLVKRKLKRAECIVPS
jgi:hypothetical protein